jgi:arylsulfatase
MVHSWATDKDDETVDPRWGKIGKQKIEDAGPLPPHPMKGIKYSMETVDWDFVAASTAFMDKAIAAKQPFFCWINPTRMHVVTHLSPKYEGMRNSKNGWTEQEAGMAELDDEVGAVMKYLKDKGLDDNTIVMFTTDNGAEQFTWPDGGQTPFAMAKGTVMEGGFRVPCILWWPGHVPADSIQNGIFSGLDWMPTFLAAAGNPDINDQLLKGAKIGDRTYKNHLDGYDQMDCITGKGESKRHEIYYFGESTLGAVRVDDFKYRFIEQPQGWVGAKVHVDMPILTNLRLDPFERTGWASDGAAKGSMQYWEWFKYEFWRFVFVQQNVAKLAKSALEYPPMQAGASFNLDALKAELSKKMAEAQEAAKGPAN